MNRYDFNVIKANVSLAEVMRSYGIEVNYKLDKQMIRCPFHDDRNPSMELNFVKNVFNCFGCGLHGTVLDFVMQIEKCSLTDAAHILGDRYIGNSEIATPKVGTFVKKAIYEEKDYSVPDIIKEIYYAIYAMTDLSDAGRDYLLNERGFKEETIRKYHLHSLENRAEVWAKLCKKYEFWELKMAGLIGRSGGFIFNDNGILIPFKLKGGVVYYLFRNMQNADDRKYICLKGMAKHYFVGDLDDSMAYVFEGVFDAMSFYQLYGKANIIAGNGTAGLDDKKINHYLKAMGYDKDLRYIYLVDNDAAGENKVKELRDKGKSAYTLKDWLLRNDWDIKLSGLKDWNDVLTNYRRQKRS